ncbi:Clr5 domain-containing protein [Apiospora arundinis]
MELPPIAAPPGPGPVNGMSDAQSKWAKPEEWNKYKNTISALFMCHSLPNVMRIMREDHDFHATSSRVQGQKKRRREATEEPAESVASSSHSYSQLPMRGAQNDFEPDIQMLEAANMDALFAPAAETERFMSSTGTGGSEIDYIGTFRVGDNDPRIKSPPPRYHLRPEVPLAPYEVPPITAPMGWQQFLTKAQLEPTDPINTNSVQGTIYSETSNADTGKWMSTVLDQPTSTLSPSTRAALSNYSAGSRSSRRSKGSSNSRASGASSSRETLLSSRSSHTQHSSDSGSRSSRMTLPTGSLRLLDSPDSLLFPEKSMFFARHYISSTFSTGLWTLSQNTDTSLLDTECVKLDAWYNDFNPGFEFLFENRSNQPDRIKRAFCIFQRCFAATEEIILPQDPRVVIYICQQTIRFLYYDTVGRNLAQTFLKYVSGLCKKLFTEHHPLYIIMSQLARMDNFEFARNIPALMNCYFDHLEPFLDDKTSAFGFVNDLRGLTISIMEATGMVGIYEAKPVLDRLVRRAKALNHKALHVQIEIAAMYQRNRYLIEARNMLRQIRSSEEAKKDPYEATYAGIILMVVLRKMRDTTGGIELGYQMVEFLSRAIRGRHTSDFEWELFKGLDTSTLMIILGKLEVELRDAKRHSEADEIKAHMDSVMSKQYEYDFDQQIEALSPEVVATEA